MDSRTVDVEEEQLPTQADEFHENTQVVLAERWPYGTKEPAALQLTLTTLGLFLWLSVGYTICLFLYFKYWVKLRFSTIVANILTFLCWVVLTIQFYHKFMSEIKMGLLLGLFSILLVSPMIMRLFFLDWYFIMFISRLLFPFSL